ncbi:MAG TPA: GrpB family protein [Acidimicrobiia bacterium]|nr:GrpB family protein [Acidimicrobiia bacterium]
MATSQLGEQGIPQRWAFRAPSEGLRTNTYVVVEGSLALRNHLAVRDTLRRDAELRAAYADLKRRLAKDLDEINAYVEAKSAVLTRILEQAGFDEDERTAIQAMNRFTRS